MAQQEKVDHLERKMEARHIQMISLGGVIGTGLFLSSGYTISQAGPIGTIIAYFFGGDPGLRRHAQPGRIVGGHALHRFLPRLR